MIKTPNLHKVTAPKKLKFAVIICSSSRYQAMKGRKPFKDDTGDLITHLIKGSGNEVLFKEIIPDDQVLIGQAVKDCLERDVDVLIISGGTGITPGDVTIEAVRPLIEKELPGFGELLRRLSFEAIGSAAMLTRALAGVVKGKVVFCIPGSPHAAKIALENIILIEAPHVIAHARGLR